MRRWFAAVVAALVVAAPVVVAAPASAAVLCANVTVLAVGERESLGLADGECVPKSPGQTDLDAIRAWAVSPGDLHENLVQPGFGKTVTLGRAVAATVAPSFGKTVIGVGQSIGASVAAGVARLVQGVAGWWFKPDSDAANLPAPPPSAGWDTSGTGNGRGTVSGLSFSGSLTGSYSLTFTPSFSGTAWTFHRTAATGPISSLTVRNGTCYGSFYNVTGAQTCLGTLGQGSTWWDLKACTAGVPCTIAGTASASVPFWGVMYSTVSGTSQVAANMIAFNYRTAYQGPVTDPYPGRTIEQTISCTRPDGSSYTYTSSADASMALSASSTVAVAGLMCDTGDRATGTGATLKSPGKPDVTIIKETATTVKSSKVFSNVLPSCAYSAAGCVVSNPSSEPAVPTVAAPLAAPSYPVGSPGASFGTDECGLSWSALLDPAAVFRVVSCSMRWAFVPSAAAVTSVSSSLDGAWKGTGLSGWSSAAAGVGSGLAGALSSADSGCAGPQFTIRLGGHDYRFAPLDACAPPMSGVAVVVKVLASAFLIIAGVLFIGRPVLAAFGLGSAVR